MSATGWLIFATIEYCVALSALIRGARSSEYLASTVGLLLGTFFACVGTVCVRLAFP